MNPAFWQNSETTLMTKTRMITRAHRIAAPAAATLLLAATLGLTGCPQKQGPAEKAGAALDRAKDKVADTLDPKGPGEKAGRAIDRATE